MLTGCMHMCCRDLGGWNIAGRLTPELASLDQLQTLCVPVVATFCFLQICWLFSQLACCCTCLQSACQGLCTSLIQGFLACACLLCQGNKAAVVLESGGVNVERMCLCRNVSSNNFTGGLSSTWGAPGVFPNLVTMDLSQNYLLGGILLTQWGTPGSFPKLEVLLFMPPTNHLPL